MNKERIGILGYGEIGQSIYGLYIDKKYDIGIRDTVLGYSNWELPIDVLHICIPYSDAFIDIVIETIHEVEPFLVIIHSTVAPGTTKQIIQRCIRNTHIVHSPVRGMHPDLTESLKTFIKYIGAENGESGALAIQHLRSIGIKCKLTIPAIKTEISKLLSTSYYGICIAYHNEMKKICDKENIDFNIIDHWNKTYNEGYSNLKFVDIQRPVLYPPEGKIGGHCVVPNAKILKEYFDSKFLDLIINCGEENE